MKNVRRAVEESVPVSDTVKIRIKRSMDTAERKIRNDEEAFKLLKRLNDEKEIDKSILIEEDRANFEKLLDLGLVNTYVDNTVRLSGTGVRIFGKIKQ